MVVRVVPIARPPCRWNDSRPGGGAPCIHDQEVAVIVDEREVGRYCNRHGHLKAAELEQAAADEKTIVAVLVG